MIQKLIDIFFDYMVIFVIREIIIIAGGILKKGDLSTSPAVWAVSILVGVIFAEIFTISKKK